jgi:flagellar protein FliO/FliZ
METVDFTRFFLSLAGVIAMIWLCAVLAKKFGLDKKLRGATGGQGRLAVNDVLYLDPKRKLLLVRADAREYVLLVAGDQVTVVDKLEKTDA